MHLMATVVFLAMLAVSLWAWRLAPAKQAADQFVGIWHVHPWGKQFYLDFFGLQIVLVLWMLTDAANRGSWLLVVPCILTMPIFGAMSAALYFLLRGL